MRNTRHWFLVVGLLLAMAVLFLQGDYGLADLGLLFAGGLLGLWAGELVAEHEGEERL